MDSKLKAPALRVAGWGLLHGEFFNLYTVVDLLQVPSDFASDVVHYLRCFPYVETVTETRSCKKKLAKACAGSSSSWSLSIQNDRERPPAKVDVLHSKLAQLSKTMPLPQGKR